MSASCCCGIRPTHRKLLRNGNNNTTAKPNLIEPLDLPITLQLKNGQGVVKELPDKNIVEEVAVVKKKKSSKWHIF